MRAARAVALALALVAASAAHAGVTLSIDRKSAGVKETFYLILRADGGRIQEPILPHANGLVLSKRPVNTRQQSSVQFINGQVKQNNVREWQYEGWGTQLGALEIPPAKINIDGVDVLSNAVTIQIQDNPGVGTIPQQQPPPNQPGQSGQMDSQPGQTQQQQQQQQQPQADPGEITLDDVLLIDATVSKTTVYLGEPLAYSVNFRRINEPGFSIRGDQGNNLNLPTTEGFYESEPKRDERGETIKGHQYMTTSFVKPMFATKPGTYTIPAVQWTGRITAPTSIGIRSFSAERSTASYTIEVKPLPDSPPGFSGAVGKLNISAQLDGGVVEQGAPKTFTIIIAGEGNVDGIPKPVLPAMDWCHVSEPEVTVNPLAGPLEFEKRFAYALTPMRPDTHQIPQVDFCYFAPDINNYKTISTKPVDVFVQAAEDEGKLVTAGGQAAPKESSVDVLSSDIAPLFDGPADLSPRGSQVPVNTLGYTMPPLVFLAGLTYIRRQRRLATDEGFARGLRAKSRSRKRLADAMRSKDPAEALFKALTGFLGDKMNLPDQGMTSHDVRAAMQESGFSPELVDEYVKVLRMCERQRYSGAGLTPAEATALSQAAESALDHFESALAKGGRT